MTSLDANAVFGETEEEILYDGNWEAGRDRCIKSTNHAEYIDIPEDDKFEELLPEAYNTKDISSLIRHMSNLTGKVKVGKLRCTGFVQAIRQVIFPEGICTMCKGNHSGRGFILTVTTALHVVTEATAAEMELSWHQGGCPHQLTVRLCRIVEPDKDCKEKDWCAAEFIINEKRETVAKLKENLVKFQELQGELYRDYKNKKGDQLVIIVSHPHGGPKKLSYCPSFRERKILNYVREEQEGCRYSYDAPTCRGTSGAPVFILGQPLCGYGYWLGHPHIHSRWQASKAIGHSSLGYDHIDTE
ncbi:unnamed protein product [Lymnaea stagnalis]|uniref:Uncharacterized protein n=1 Tax=Lymnaea stagnalis TaxID=6523 RepID=A0AAV2HXS3_LYMST